MSHPLRLTDPPNRIVTAVLGYAVLSGVLYLTGVVSDPHSIEETLSPALRVVWACSLSVGGAAALAGQYWRGRVFTGARLKRGGLLFAAGGMLAYGAAVLLVTGLEAGLQAGLANVVFGLVFADRARQVGGLLRAAQPHAEAIHRERDRGGDGECDASG